MFQIESETAAATDKSNQSLTSLGYLRARLQELKEKYIENEQRVDNAEMAAQEANKLALRAEEVSTCIELGTTLLMQTFFVIWNVNTGSLKTHYFSFFKAANQLRNKYTTTAQDLNSRYNLTTQAQSRAETLKRRADKLATDTTAKLKKLKGKRIVVTIKQIVPLMITEYKDDFSQFTFALRGQILN